METSALVIIFGSLLAFIAMVVGGAIVGGPWGHAALALGLAGIVAWVAFAFWLSNAMNTDI